MVLESSSTILYVAKISYQSDNWFGNCKGGDQNFTQTHRHTHTHTDTHTHTQTHTHTDRHTHTDTHTPAAYLISPFFFSKKNLIRKMVKILFFKIA